MSVSLASNLVPKNNGDFFLLEDIYFKGGFQVRATVDERDAIPDGNRKEGMLVLTLSDKKTWRLEADLLAWSEHKQTQDFIVFATAEERDAFDASSSKPATLSFTAEDMKFRTLNADLLGWTILDIGSGGSGGGSSKRKTFTKTVTVPAMLEANFAESLANTCALLQVSVNAPCVVSIFGTPARDETNPYIFSAGAGHLSDDGSTVLTDGSVVRNRRYAIVSNLEEIVSDKLYFTISNSGETEIQVELSIIYVPMEM